MARITVEQKSIMDLFQNEKADFLIPDCQRPYAWGTDECETLWNDIFTFAFPDNDRTKFNPKKRRILPRAHRHLQKHRR